MTTVGEFMTTRLVTMDGNDTLIAAAQEMRDSAIGDVVVTNGDDVVGIVTDRDITVRGVAGTRSGLARFHQITSRDVITVSQYDDAVAAADLMRTYAVRRLPVIDDGRLVGLVSMGDLAVEREPQSVLADISADDPTTDRPPRTTRRPPGAPGGRRCRVCGMPVSAVCGGPGLGGRRGLPVRGGWRRAVRAPGAVYWIPDRRLGERARWRTRPRGSSRAWTGRGTNRC